MTDERMKLVEDLRKAKKSYRASPTGGRRIKIFEIEEALRAYDAAHSEEVER